MKGSHVHVGVRDFGKAVQWMSEVWGRKPAFSNDRMAVIPLDGFSLILDASDEDTTAVIAFDSQDCDGDFKTVTDRGAEAMDAPADQPWGVRVAYIRGPGNLTFEIEQALSAAERGSPRKAP